MQTAINICAKDRWLARSLFQSACDRVNAEGCLKSNDKNLHTFAATFYKHLFATFPQYEVLFFRFNLKQTLVALYNLLDEKPISMEKQNCNIAERHVRYGLQLEHFDAVRVCLQHTFTVQFADWYDETRKEAFEKAWQELMKIMIPK